MKGMKGTWSERCCDLVISCKGSRGAAKGKKGGPPL